MNRNRHDQLMREFRDRWKAVEAVEAEEQRRASVALRWQQLNAVLRMAIDMGLPLSNFEQDEAAVFERWAKLKGS